MAKVWLYHPRSDSYMAASDSAFEEFHRADGWEIAPDYLDDQVADTPPVPAQPVVETPPAEPAAPAPRARRS